MSPTSDLEITMRARDQASQAMAQMQKVLEATSKSMGGLGPASDTASSHVGKLAGHLDGVKAAADRGRGGIGGLVDMLGKVGLAGMGISALANAAKGLGDTLGLGLNVEMENVKAQLMAFTKDGAKAESILKDIRAEADKTPFAFAEMAKATAGLMAPAKTSGAALMDLVKQAEILAASNPAQGLEGAAFALREAVSGDFTSIIERFNLPRSYINKLKEEGVPALQIVSKAMLEMGYDSDLVGNLAKTASGRWSTFMDTIDGIKVKLSKPLFEFLSQQLANVQGWLDSNKTTIEGWANAAGDLLGGAAKIAGEWLGRLSGVIVSLVNAGKMLFTGDFQGGIFGLEEDDPIINALFTIRNAVTDLVGVFTGAEGAGLKLHNALESIVGLDVANVLILAVQGIQRIGDAIKSLIPEPLVTFVANLRESIDQSGILGTVGQALAGTINALARGFVDLTKFVEDNKLAQVALVSILTMAVTTWTAMKVAALAHAAVMGVQAVATGVLTAAQTALNFAMTANPIGLIVVALAGLVAGFIYAYNTSEEFRAVVDGALKAVGGAFDALLNAGRVALDFLGTALKTVGDIANAIGGAITATWNKVPLDIRKDLELIGSTLVTRFGTFLANTSQWLSDTWTAISRAWADITALTERAWGAVLGIFTATLSETGGALGVITSFVGNVLAKLGNLATDALKIAGDIGGAIIDGIREGIRAGWSTLTDMVGNLARDLLGAAKRALGISSPSKEFFKIGQNIIDGVIAGLRDRNTSFLDAIRGMAGDAASLMGNLIDRTIGGPNASILSRGASAANSLMKLISERFTGQDVMFGFPRIPNILSGISQQSQDMQVFGQIRDVVDAMREMGMTIDQEMIGEFRNLGQFLGGPVRDALDRFLGTLDQQDALKGLKDFLADADLGRQLASTASVLQSLGQAMPDSLRSLLENVPRIEGGVLDTIIKQLLAGAIPGFASGGVVPGALGAPRLIVAHGGEEVRTRGQQGPQVVKQYYLTTYSNAPTDQTIANFRLMEAMA